MAAAIEHIAVNWCRVKEGGNHPEDFDGFWRDYQRSVEMDVDPLADNPDRELLRVWTNHAAILRGELDMVFPRPRRNRA